MKLITIFFALTALTPAVYSIDLQLADYEALDPTVTLSSPDSGVRLEIVSGGGDAPIPSSGAKMLQLSWSNETDRKIEIKHDWSGMLEFDLAGMDRLLVDLYIPADVVAATNEASTLLGIWDPVIGWRPTLDAIITDQWVTYGFDISGNTAVGLDAIHALLVEYLGADAGVIYIDNFRISSALIREQALHRQGPLTTVDSDVRITDYDGSGNTTNLQVDGQIEADSMKVGNQSVVLYDSDQHVTAAQPMAPNHVATKAYVDAVTEQDPVFAASIAASIELGHIDNWNAAAEPQPDIWSVNGSKIYRTDGFVGIGTDAPDSPLHIKGSYFPWGVSMELDGGNVGGDGGRRWQLISTAGNAVEGQGVFLIKDISANPLSGGNRHLAIYPSGAVAIGPQGKTVPTSKLHVAGNISAEAPTEPNHVATKAYVDAQGGGNSGAAHKLTTPDQQTDVIVVDANGTTTVTGILRFTAPMGDLSMGAFTAQ